MTRCFAFLGLSFIALASVSAQEQTCADRTTAGLTGPCVQPVTVPSNTVVGGVALPTAWLGPAPVCQVLYSQKQLATPTFMPHNSTCSAYANSGCCSSETVIRRVRWRRSVSLSAVRPAVAILSLRPVRPHPAERVIDSASDLPRTGYA